MVATPSPQDQAQAQSYALRVLPHLIARGTLTVADAMAATNGSKPGCNRGLNELVAALPGLVERRAAERVPNGHQWYWLGSAATAADRAETRRRFKALAVARSLAGALPGRSVVDALDAMIREHGAAVGHGVADLGRMLVCRFGAKSRSNSTSHAFDQLLTAIFDGKTARFDYTANSGRRAHRRVEPWTLAITSGGVHVHGRCLEGPGSADGRRPLFSLSRVENVQLGETFPYPTADDYKAQASWDAVFLWWLGPESVPVETVSLEFDWSWKNYLDSTVIHPSMVVLDGAAGGVICVEVRVAVAYDLVHWIRGHGSSVRVLAPEALRDWVESNGGPEWRASVTS